MPITLSHQEVRSLAKNLCELTGREVKHTEIIEAIAKAVGKRPDAMMHELKHESASNSQGNQQSASSSKAAEIQSAEESTMTAQDSIRIAKNAGFEIWETGGGCRAFAKLLKEVPTTADDVASMDLMITAMGGGSIDAAPDDRVWMAGINYTDPRGGESPRVTEEDTLTLAEAIAAAAEFEKEAEAIWAESYDADAIAAHEGNRGRTY